MGRRDHNASRLAADVKAEGACTLRKTLMCAKSGCCGKKHSCGILLAGPSWGRHEAHELSICS